MVQPTHDRKSNYLVACVLSARNHSALLWDLLLDPLMRSCLIEVDHIRIEHALELLLMQDQQMVQAFLSHTPQKAFADRVGSWGLNRRFEDLDRARFRYPSEARPELAIVITNQVLWCEPIGVASRSCWATQASVGDRVTPTWITFRDLSSTTKKAKSGRKKMSVTCKKSHAQT